jgi:hypothetical protein
MRAGLRARLEKLQRLQEEGRLQTAVIWLGLDGEPETPVEGLPQGRGLSCCPARRAPPKSGQSESASAGRRMGRGNYDAA